MKNLILALALLFSFSFVATAQETTHMVQIVNEDGSRDSSEWSDIYPSLEPSMDSVLHVKQNFKENITTGKREACQTGTLLVEDLFPMALNHYSKSPEWLLEEKGNETVSFDTEVNQAVMNSYYSFVSLNPNSEIHLVEVNLIHMGGQIVEVEILSYKENNRSVTGLKAVTRQSLILR